MQCMGAADQAEEANKESMFQTWAEKSPDDAANVLAQEDIVVTNMKDKEQQMGVLHELAEKAGDLYQQAIVQEMTQPGGAQPGMMMGGTQQGDVQQAGAMLQGGV